MPRGSGAEWVIIWSWAEQAAADLRQELERVLNEDRGEATTKALKERTHPSVSRASMTALKVGLGRIAFSAIASSGR